MSDKNTFILNVPQHPYKLELRWTLRLDPAAAESLAVALDSIHGVERVIMHRYAAEIFFAAHLVTHESLAPYIHTQVRLWAQNCPDIEII